MRLWIVCPCFRDTRSFKRVREEALVALEAVLPGVEKRFVLVDDTGGQDPEVRLLGLPDVTVLTPPYNLGHQGALVWGLRTLRGQVDETDLVVTMDSDGEDRPEDLGALLAPLVAEPEALNLVGIALRTERRESLLFKVFYVAFKTAFRVLTGTVIRNGNFAAYRGWLLRDVIFHPHFDQCYSSSFISLPMRLARVPLPRGTRFDGRSRMGLMGLFIHGVRMLMPFSEVIAARGMMASAAVLGAAGTALVASMVLGGPRLLPAVALVLGVLGLGFSVLLFATFSQNKSRSLRGLSHPSSSQE